MARRKSRPPMPFEVTTSFHLSQDSVMNVTSSSFSIEGDSPLQDPSSQSSESETCCISDPTRTMASSKDSKRMMLPRPGNTACYAECKVADTTVVPESSQYARSLDHSTSLKPSTTPVNSILGFDKGNISVQSHIAHLLSSISPPSPLNSSLGTTSVMSAIPKSPDQLRRTSSLLRLSMSFDGKAEVTTGSGNSPSLPRSQFFTSSIDAPSRPVVLQRSKSAVATVDQSSQDGHSFLPLLPRRTMTGRSRDARTWEFYCDSDARNALTAQAEQEQSGSAVGAIGLIRSRSQKSMTPNPNKRNAKVPKPESLKRLKPTSQLVQKPKLARAISSVARLQTVNGNTQIQALKRKDRDVKSSSQTVGYDDGDSDKENWAPGTQISNVRRMPRPQTSRRPVLGENAHMPSHSSSLDALMNRENITPRRLCSKKGESNGQVKAGSEVDDEVAGFMSGAKTAREDDDFDCVQNLLSLSQAAWQ